MNDDDAMAARPAGATPVKSDPPVSPAAARECSSKDADEELGLEEDGYGYGV
jgi:hypothetical protein